MLNSNGKQQMPLFTKSLNIILPTSPYGCLQEYGLSCFLSCCFSCCLNAFHSQRAIRKNCSTNNTLSAKPLHSQHAACKIKRSKIWNDLHSFRYHTKKYFSTLQKDKGRTQEGTLDLCLKKKNNKTPRQRLPLLLKPQNNPAENPSLSQQTLWVFAWWFRASQDLPAHGLWHLH